MNIKKTVTDYLFVKSCDGSRSILLLSSLALGICIIFFPNSLDPTIEKILAPNLWAAILFSYSIVGLINLRKNKDATYVEAFIGFLIWTIMTSGICITAKTATMLAVPFGIFSIMSWWILIRAGIRHG